MSTILVFDIYGTLINTSSTFDLIQSIVPEKANTFTKLWRQKQLEYSFRRGLMQLHVDFSVCTEQALEFTCRSLELTITDKQKAKLINSYSELPIFDDVANTLKLAKKRNLTCCAFSNGSRQAVKHLLKYNNILPYFAGVISTADIKSFKPDPGVYAHCLRQINKPGHTAWMISSNPFDVLGAKSAGMRAAWIKRSDNDVMDPWEIQPDLTLQSLEELVHKI